jgi:protein Tob/BTG
MRQEVLSAVNFISGLLRHRKTLIPDEIDRFSNCLFKVLMTRYSNHWFPEHPFKGSAFRCIRIVKRKLDPVVVLAATDAGISESRLQELLPSELTLWVDPNDVCYRFGEDGSIGVVPDNYANTTTTAARSDSVSSTSYDNCRNEHLKQRSEFVDVMSTVIAV